MKVFISWSGDRSKQMAEAIRTWLPRVLQAVTPWISTHDIGKGTRWAAELSKELSDHIYGVICLTPENRNNPWILYEAGALSKTQPSQTFTLLLGLTYADVEQPLAQFNHTLTTRDEMHSLVRTMNASLEHPLTDELLDHSFQTNWSYLEDQFAAIAAASPPLPQPAQVGPPESRDVRSMIEEMLNILRAPNVSTSAAPLVNATNLSFQNLVFMVSTDMLRRLEPNWTVQYVRAGRGGISITLATDMGGSIGFSIPEPSSIDQIQARIHKVVTDHRARLLAQGGNTTI